MIIKCPNCGRRFELQRRPPERFKCPKCRYTTFFSEILGVQNANSSSENPMLDTPSMSDSLKTGDSAATSIVEKPTKVVDDLLNQETMVVKGLGGGEKTELIPGLQKKQQGILQVTYRGTNYGVVRLPLTNNFSLGRRSSDSNAQVKLTPDMTMSRIHAGMRLVTSPMGNTTYQITSAKDSNPVYVNRVPIPKGKPINLKNGDTLQMGETIMIFRLI